MPALRKVGSTVKEAAAGVALLVKDTKVWQSTCDWLKKHISDIADLAGSAVKSTVDGVLAKLRGGMNTLLYKYINRKADDIYAELKDLVDEDALDCLQKSFNQHRNLKLLTTISEWVSSAQKIKGGKLKEYEVLYIDNAVANGTARETILETIKGYVSSVLTIPTLPKGSLPKGMPEPEGKNTDIKLQNEFAKILAAAGYDLEMLELKDEGNGYGREEGTNPDYRIMNRIFDCYSPKEKSEFDTICKKLQKKVKRQADRIVLNVSRVPKDQLGELKQVILRKTGERGDLRELQELIVIFEDERIETWFAR